MNGQRLIAAIVLVSVTTSSGVNVVAAGRPSTRGSASPTAPAVRALRGPAPVLVEGPISSTPSAAQGDDNARATQAAAPQPDAATRQRVDQALSTLPLRFVPHADPVAHFTARWADHTVFFAEEEIVFSAVERAADDTSTWPWSDRRPPPADRPRNTRSSVVRLRFPGANSHPTLEGPSPLRGVVNYFLGNDPARWRANVPTYAAVAYRDLYPGVDLVYRGTEGRLKSEFRVAPGADPGVIQMAYEGVEALRLRDDGALVLETPLGELVETAPLIYQEVDGVRREVPGGYVVGQDDVLSYRVGAYDPACPLVIDPELTYSSYLGGSDWVPYSGWDYGHAIAVDSLGNIYMTGWTCSEDFPSYNAIQPTLSPGGDDAFVTQIISAGGVYTYGYSTFLGGYDQDYGTGIAVDSAGNTYVTGWTYSEDFPTCNAIQPTKGDSIGARDAFVTQIISASGVYTLAYSTYLGGNSGDYTRGIAVSAYGGDAYVTGLTWSTDFPTHNAIQPTLAGGGNCDAFVTQITSAGGVYTYGYSTYLGGSSGEESFGITVDDMGNAHVTGSTASSDFPVHDAVQATHEGGTDAFATKIINISGVYTYGYSTYLGGAADEGGQGIAIDSAGNIYVTGETYSSDFPTHNAIQAIRSGGRDAFVTQIIDVSGVYTYGYSTYLGGSGDDSGYGIAVPTGDIGNAYVTGETGSDNFPTHHSIQTNQGGTDAFVTQIVDTSGVYTYGYSTYLGGGNDDWGVGIAVDSAGNAHIVGTTASTDFLTTTNAIQPNHQGGGYDAFVAQIACFADLALSKTVTPDIVRPGQPLTYTLVYTNNGPDAATSVLITDVVPITLTSVSYSSSDPAVISIGDISYTWRVGNLLMGDGGVITVTGIVSPAVSGAFSLTNQATVAAMQGDTDTVNNTSMVSNAINSPRQLYLPLVMREYG